jgi:hypothetical protein
LISGIVKIKRLSPGSPLFLAGAGVGAARGSLPGAAGALQLGAAGGPPTEADSGGAVEQLLASAIALYAENKREGDDVVLPPDWLRLRVFMHLTVDTVRYARPMHSMTQLPGPTNVITTRVHTFPLFRRSRVFKYHTKCSFLLGQVNATYAESWW